MKKPFLILGSVVGFAVLLVVLRSLSHSVATGNSRPSLSQDAMTLTLDLGDSTPTEFVYVPESADVLTSGPTGSGGHGDVRGLVQAGKGYYIARYELTCGSWETFMKEGGYSDKRWWKAIPRGNYLGLTEPELWDAAKKRDGFRTLPLCRITAMEALACLAWARDRTGLDIDIPEEWEWEHAADPEADQHNTAKLLFPWGDEGTPGYVDIEDAVKANLGYIPAAGSKFGKTMPGGTYPDDRSWCGVFDLAGNVKEWVWRNESEDIVSKGGWCLLLHSRSGKIDQDMAETAKLSYSDSDYNYEFQGYFIGLRLLIPAESVAKLLEAKN